MSKSTDLGLLALRLGFGAAAASHGAQKLLGWFGGYGIEGTGGFFESVGFTPGKRNATLAGRRRDGRRPRPSRSVSPPAPRVPR